MGRRLVVAAAVLALALVLAGCVGDGGTATPNATAETTAVRTVSYPEGLSADGVTDPDALMLAHADALAETDYTLTLRPASEPRNWSYTVRSNVTSERQRTRRSVTGPDPILVETYVEGDAPVVGAQVVQYRKTDTGDGYPVYDAAPFQSEFEYFHTRPLSGQLHTILNDTQQTATEAVRRGEHTYVHYTLTSATAYDRSKMGTLVVRDDGLVTSVHLTGAVTGGRGYVLRYDTANVTVTEPGWTARASVSSGGSGGGGVGGDPDCDDFASQAAAQAYHERTGGAGLDGDGDGVACEALD